jgi:putative ABC transport system substrate-binding protein
MRTNGLPLVAGFVLAFAAHAAIAEGLPPRIALVIPGPSDCVKDALTLPAMQESDIDPATVSQFCYSELKDVPRLMQKIVGTKPSIILIFASAPAVRAAREASPTVPIVFADVPDPVKNGLAKSLAHPGMNMTGIVSNSDVVLAKRVEIMREALPQVTRVAVLCNLDNDGQRIYVRAAQEAARTVQLQLTVYDVQSRQELAPAFAAMERDRMQAVLLMPDAWLFPNRVEVFALAASHRVPVVSGNVVYAELGGLLTYGANLTVMAKTAWGYVHRILDGANAGDLPASQPLEFDYILNLKTARELGVKISPLSKMRATRIIE